MYNSNLFKDIVSKLFNNQIDKLDAVDGLISLIEKTNDSSLRIQSMELLNKLEPENSKLFQLYENCLISDEDELIRKQAAKLLFQNYFDQGYESLKWAILNEKSTKVLKVIKTRIDRLPYPKSQLSDLSVILKQRLKQVSELYSLDINETELLIDLEINLNGKNYYIYTANSGYIIEENFTCFMKDNHIRELSISLFKEIPSKIYLLTLIESLNLSFNYLSSLPSTITHLSKLKTLDLSWNEFTEVPEILLKLVNLEQVDLRNNKINTHLSTAKELFSQNKIIVIF